MKTVIDTKGGAVGPFQVESRPIKVPFYLKAETTSGRCGFRYWKNPTANSALAANAMPQGLEEAMFAVL